MKVSQSCLALCDLIDYTVHGILQARILERVALPCSRGSSRPRKRTGPPALQADSFPTELSGKPEQPIKRRKKEIKFLKTNENGNTIYQNIQDAGKAILRGKFIAINATLRSNKNPK